MAYIWLLIRQILRDMGSHKLRSFLALFGITWGVISVVLLLSLGTGFSQATRDNLITLVDGTFFIGPQATSLNYQGYPKGRLIKIKVEEVMRLKTVFPSIKLISPMVTVSQALSYKDKKSERKVTGVSPDFYILRKIPLTLDSRFIDPIDIKRAAKVAILGYQTKKILFGEEEAIGKTIFLRGIPFKVIGVIQPPYKMTHRFHNREIFIPYTTFVNVYGKQDIKYFMAFPDPERNPAAVKQDIMTYLGNEFHFSPQDKEAMQTFDTTKVFQFFKWFFISIKLFLGLCGLLTLGVGCLSVTNIMFLMVSERTQEIGIRMTVGAKPWHIRLQIILETVVITLLGGIIGFLISFFIIAVLQNALLPEWLGRPEFSYLSAIITVTILLLLGVSSGYFPAERASRLDPIDAIMR